MDTPNTSIHLHKLLDGYAFSEWPDLSSDRSPPNRAEIASKQVPSCRLLDENSRTSLIVLAIAYTIGAYCGTKDLLLAIQDGEDATRFLRVRWNDDQDWDELISTAKSDLSKASRYPLSLAELRNILSLADSQYPCPALLRFDQSDSSFNSNYPAIFDYDSCSATLKLSSSMSTLHPTVSSQFVEQVDGLVGWVLEHASTKLATIPALPSELLSVCEKGTDEAVAQVYRHLPPVSFAPDYLSIRAKDMPHAIAVRWYPELSLDSDKQPFESISYQALDREANQVARWLIQSGLEQEGRVAICLDRNLKFHAAMMGIMRAGGCYVPIDPELPLERKVYIAKDANVTFVLTSVQIASPDVFGSLTRYIEDKSIQLDIFQENDSALDCMKPDSLAYLLYTSGTTGNPKGCLLTHRGLAQAILALSSTAADVRMNNIHDGRYLAVASIAFDVHLAETIVPFALGMPLLSARRSQLLENLPTYVNKLGITHLGIVPSLIEATLNAAQSGSDIALRYIASGGEKMSNSILDKWADHPQVRLANFYGPSEVTIGCCARYMASATPRANIGRALANVSAYVVDSNMNILLKGGVGELVVEGPLVGRGYQGRPDLTEKVFMEWPHPGCWAYRTGDLVRMMPDCTIEIIGRIDTQIKLRGVRIESEGISAIVRSAIPPSDSISLDVATVLAKHPAINVEQLVSLFSWNKTIPIATRKSKKPHIVVPPAGLLKQIKARCESELASYMRPSHLIPLSWLPLSSNGKIDAKILTQLLRDLPVEVLANISTAEDSEISRPCTDTENKVFDTLRKHVALPFDKPHPDLNVFECGLDSMAVIRFSSELKTIFNTKVSASVVMKGPRISEIASYLQSSQASHVCGPLLLNTDLSALYADPTLPCVQDQIEEVLPPFTVQEGVLARSSDSHSLYVQHVILSLGTHISLSKLRTAWKFVSDQHQILRTIFHFGRVLSQIVLKRDVPNLNWQEHVLSSVHDNNFVGFFLHGDGLNVAKEINQNLSTTVAYRLSAYSTPGQNFLVLSIHHALFDGISLPRIFWEVEQAYLDHPCVPPTSSSDILAQISAINLDEAKRFWTKHFLGFAWTQPSLHPVSSRRTQRLVIPFKSSLSSLKALAASQQVTLQALLTSGFALLIARHIYKCRDVVFGVLRSGRLLPIDDIDDAICPLVSVVPTRVSFDMLGISPQTIQQDISSVVEYEHVPLGKVQTWIRPGKSLFDILFSLSVGNSSKTDLWSVIESEPPEADYALAVEVVLNPTNDSLLVQAAWIDHGRDQIFESCLRELEDSVYGLSTNPTSYIEESLSELPRTSYQEISKPLQEPLVEENSDIDPALLNKLQSIVAEFLQVRPTVLTPSTSFVSMGLDSIKSVGLAKILTLQGHSATSTDVLRYATLRQLAYRIQSKLEAIDHGLDMSSDSTFAVHTSISTELLRKNIGLNDDDVVELFPTTALQSGMLSQTIHSHGKLYLHSFPLRIDGDFDLDKLRLAWNTAVRKFAILRTSFHFATESGTWVQAVHSNATLSWAEYTLKSSGDYKDTLQNFLSTIKLDDEASFGQPPIWVRLFNTGTAGSTLVLVMHHALYDGGSIGLLVRAVEAFYENRAYQYEKQFHEFLPQILDQQRDGVPFWTGKLSAINPAPLPRIHSSVDATSVALERHIPLEPTRLKQVLREASVTMQCVCQAVWAKVMAKYTGVPEVVFGHTVSGRNTPGAEGVIGPVLNTVPCCIRLEPGMTNIQFLNEIHQFNLDALPYQQASTRAIQKALGVTAIWDSLFLFQHTESQSDAQNPNLLWTFDDDAEELDIQIQYPLNVEMFACDTSVLVKCASNPDYIDKEGLDAIATDCSKFFEDIITHLHDGAFTDLNMFTSRPASMIDQQKYQPKSQQYESISSTHITVDPSIYEILMSLTNTPRSLMRPETPLAAIGIDSITAIQIASKLRQTGIVIAASDVTSSATIGQMATKIGMKDALQQSEQADLTTRQIVAESERAEIAASLNVPATLIESVNVTSSGMQWLIGAWSQSRRTRFQHVFPFQLPADVDKERMKASWLALVDRHPILRSTFACVSGNYEPRIVTFKKIAPECWSEECVASEAFFESSLTRMKELVSNPTPISQSQARALFFYSSDRSYLILHLHHFQYDAWSLQLLVHDLSAIYANATTTTSNNLESFLNHYPADNEKQLEEQRAYWQNCFPSNFNPTLFPALNSTDDAPRETERIVRTNTACIQNASVLHERALSLGISLQSVFLASWARVQGHFSGGESSTFGLWQSGRTGSLNNIENLAVPCMNVIPMHVPSIRQKPAVELAMDVFRDLRARTSVIEQSSQIRVTDWVGGGKDPMTNVFVNIIKVAPDVSADNQVLLPVDVPYFVPTDAKTSEGFMGDELAITHLIKDDLFIDIATIEKSDTVMMSIDCAAHLMIEVQADDLMSRWSEDVQHTLGIF